MTITHGADEESVLSDEMDTRLYKIEKELVECKAMLVAISETLVKADTTITKVAAEVMPTLDGLLKSPMLKMFLPKEKK
jgi:hypothetical protein